MSLSRSAMGCLQFVIVAFPPGMLTCSFKNFLEPYFKIEKPNIILSKNTNLLFVCEGDRKIRPSDSPWQTS